MMTLVKFISLTIVSLALNACQFNSFPFNKGVRGNGVVVTEQRSIDASFNSIEVSTGIDLFLTQNESPSISVQTDENIQEFIITEIENEVLKIYIDENTYRVASKKVVVNFKTIEEIKASSGSAVFSTNTLNVPSLDLSTSSGSELTLEGNTETFSGDSSSGSHLNASKLTAKFCETKASSGSNLSVKCLEEFNAKASSGAAIENHESAMKNTVESSSGGNIETKN